MSACNRFPRSSHANDSPRNRRSWRDTGKRPDSLPPNGYRSEARKTIRSEGSRVAPCAWGPHVRRLCVFLPPTERIDDCRELVIAAEQAEEDAKLPVQIEEYALPVAPGSTDHEAGNDSLCELEVALDQIHASEHEDVPMPWRTDRIPRSFLTDGTGNTHRAEICIDMPYSPDGPTGRLGLIEFLGFEMRAHLLKA